MSRRDRLARLLIGARFATAAPPKRKASFPRDVATGFIALARRQGLRNVFPHSRILPRPSPRQSLFRYLALLHLLAQPVEITICNLQTIAGKVRPFPGKHTQS